MIRRILLTVLGGFLGAASYDEAFLFFGAALGFVVALYLDTRDALQEVTARLDGLERRSAPAPAALEPVETVPDEAGPVLDEPAHDEPATPALEPEAPVAAEDSMADAATPEERSRRAAMRRRARRGAAAATPAPSAPAEPSLPAQAWALLTGGNPLARIGVAILFVGLFFLIGYVSEQGLFPIELRLLGTALAGLGLVGGGWVLRRRAEVYAVTLQGGGVAVMYLTVFAAFQLYDVLPPLPAFALLVAIAAFSAVLAVVQDAPVLAVVGVLGGFAAPILASTGQGDHVLLFSYYTVLNAGVFGIAYVKQWRSLYLVGFLCTFVIGGVWGGLRYEPALFASTEPFLVLFFALYFAIPVLATRRGTTRLAGPIDGPLVFGLPVAAFALQAVLVEPFAFGRAWSAFALALAYLGTATLLFRGRREAARPLVEAFVGIGLTFATLTIPFALDAVWSGALWALEGAALVWTGVRQRRLWLRLSGLGLQFVSVVVLFDESAFGFDAAALGVRLSGWLAAIALGASAYWFQARPEVVRRLEYAASGPVLLLAVFLWSLSGLTLVADLLPDVLMPSAWLLFFAASAVALAEVGRRLDWNAAGAVALPLLLGAGWLLVPASLLFNDHPFGHFGWLAWLLAFAALGWVLVRREGVSGPRRLSLAHALSLWLLAAVAATEVAWALDRWVGEVGWSEAGVGIVLAGLLALVLAAPGPVGRWTARHRAAYLGLGAGGLAVALLGWSLLTNLYSTGDPAPLPYLPLLNPFDLAHVGALLVLTAYVRQMVRGDVPPSAPVRTALYSALGLGVFVAVSGLVARTVHHLADVPFTEAGLFDSTLFQTALSITWALLAMAVMLAATRFRLRTPWFVGAALLALVGVKLFAVDLSNAGTLARIVSFVGVGLLVLLIGYFSPAPPRRDEPDPPDELAPADPAL
ncbi:MAG: DUF2339 domain-containing protein [Bacteroidota bacterium]